jgi:oligoendopeptidase F
MRLIKEPFSITNQYLSPHAEASSPATTGSSAIGALPTWNLSDLYPSMECSELKADIERARTECRNLVRDYRGKLAEIASHQDASSLLAVAIQRYEMIDDIIGKIISYAGLLYADDSTNPINSKFYGDTQDQVTSMTSEILFFQLELNRIDDLLLDKAAQTLPLNHYAPWLSDIRRDKPHQLDDKIEQLFLEKSTSSASAWNRLFDETIASLRFQFGEESLSIEPILNKLQDADGEIRRQAAEALSKTFQENIRIFTLITNTLAKDKEISDRWHHFEDIADSRHLSNRVEGEVVDAMVSAVRSAYPRLSHRYYALKARWFGVDALNYWDRNAPLPKTDQRDIPWLEARDTILSAYGRFSPEMAHIAKQFFDLSWIDAPVRPGKAPGAFAHPTTTSAHPYILLNYQGKSRDVMTLAHELGHGVHQVLASHNGPLMAPTPLTLAETASVFGEMLTFRALLDQATDPLLRKSMLAGKVEDMLNTVVRQIAFYSFERIVHLERREGELTSARLGKIWLKVQSESLGPAIRLDSKYENYWSYIPHFIHSPFYVYAYAFGDCLVNSLFAVYENAPEGFAEKYMAMLRAGGTKHHSEVLAPFGLDARDPAFWQSGLSLIERMITELELLE